mgnify:CR=1 FL=1
MAALRARRRSLLCVTPVLVLLDCAFARRLTREAEDELKHFERSFSVSLGHDDGSSCRRSAVVLDVGSNDGMFSAKMMKTLQRHRCVSSGYTLVRLIMVEPQPIFHSALNRIADTYNGTLFPRAAWTSDATLNLTVGKNSQKASIVRNNDGRSAPGPRGTSMISVRTFDLAKLLLVQLREEDQAVMMKLDVEGSEYRLLPHLLTHGALCRGVTHLRIEWHLHNLEESERLAGLALKQSLPTVLRGCPKAPRVLNEEFRPLNWGQPVPGLLEETIRHTARKVGADVVSGSLAAKYGINFTLWIDVQPLHRSFRAVLLNGKRKRNR